MRFPNFRHPLMALVGIWALLLAAPLASNAEEDASTLSGRVVDMEGHPVSDLTLGIQPIDIIEGEMWQIPTPMQQSRTNSIGSFRIGGIVPGHAKLVVVPKSGTFEPDTEIRSINIGGLSFLPIDKPNFQVSHEQRIRFVSTFEVEPKKVSNCRWHPALHQVRGGYQRHKGNCEASNAHPLSSPFGGWNTLNRRNRKASPKLSEFR